MLLIGFILGCIAYPLVAKATTIQEGIPYYSSLALLEAPKGVPEAPQTALFAPVRPVNEKEMLAYIEYKESKGNHLAQNSRSTAFGRFQFLDSTWQTVGCVKTSDPVEQERCARIYMKERYGSIEGAYWHHVEQGWY